MSGTKFRIPGNLEGKWLGYHRNALRIFALGLAFYSLAFSTSAARTQEALNGEWAIESGASPDYVNLTLYRDTGNSTFKGLSKVKLESLKGLSSELISAKDNRVSFQILRDAGTFACKGQVTQGKGSGIFTFTPSQGFLSDMRALGYEKISQDLLFQMAARNVTMNFIQGLRNLGYDHIPAVKLISMWLHNVTPEFAIEMKSMGYDQLSLGDLYSLRIYSVTPEYIRDIGSLGFNHLPVKQLVAMRIHGVNPGFIREIHSLGYENISADQLISLRVFDITPAFIQKAKASGSSDLSINQLIKVKNRGSQK